MNKLHTKFSKLINEWTTIQVYKKNTKGVVLQKRNQDSQPATIENGSNKIIETTLPVFIHPKALTFPVIVGLVRGAWFTLESLSIPWFSTVWFPFVVCILLGLLITISNLSESKPKPTKVGWLLGIFVGLLNSIVIFGAVIAKITNE